MSISSAISSSIAPILFLKEFTFSGPIVSFLAFCYLCAVSHVKTFSAPSSAEFVLLNDLLLSTIGLTGHYYPGKRAIQIFAIFARRHWLKVTS